jgi:hypothetical protein
MMLFPTMAGDSLEVTVMVVGVSVPVSGTVVVVVVVVGGVWPA